MIDQRQKVVDGFAVWPTPWKMDSGDVKAFWLKPREMVTTYTITITKSREKKGRGGDDDATNDDDDGGGLVVYPPPRGLASGGCCC